jgi:Ti-type conjugative transfer relaxase TraA
MARESLPIPPLGLDAITQQRSTFTQRDMAKFAHRHSDGLDQFNEVMGAMRSAPDLVELGKDARGEDRFTTRDMIEAEQRLHRATELMAERERHAVDDADRQAALLRAEQRGLVLSDEQADALAHITDGRDLGIVVGYAGTGKSAMLGVARDAWEAAGYEVRGVALSGIAAENLEAGSGIVSRTIASMEHGWHQGRDLLTNRNVLVIDEAGMVGTRQLERVLSHAAEASAKVVLVGDPQQLQAIEAGAAFRSIHERHGGAEIGEVRRQREDWQREATRDLANGKTGNALGAYRSHGMVHEAQTREQAHGDLVERWDRDRQASPDKSRIILTHTNDEVRALNEAARERMRAAGDLGDEVRVTVERGGRDFTSGDRVMFLQNERGLGVKNGTLGTIEWVNAQSMAVRTDDGRSVHFDLKDYNKIDHGYAATIHKAQGMTVDSAHVLATPGMDAHSSYIALSRHHDGVELHYGRDDLPARTGLPAPCRAIARRTWPLTTFAPIRRSAMPSGAGSPSANALPRSCAGSCRRSCATGSMACARLPTLCVAWTAHRSRSGKRRKEKGALPQPIDAKPRRRKGRWRKRRKRNCVAYVPERLCAMPEPWMRSSRRRRWAARQVPRW